MTKHTDKLGRWHREDGPAIENADGSFAWYRHGELHRADGPAVRLVFSDGTSEEQWWLFGHEVGCTIYTKDGPISLQKHD